MPVFVSFVMGPKEGYLFNSPTHWAWHNLPPDVEALFTKQPPIKDVIEFALGEEGAYFVSYRDADGAVYCRHYNLPNPLTSYLYHSHPHVIRDLSTLSITLGPYASYYAHDKSSASWSNLPPTLEKAVLSRLESQDAWKTIWKNGGREAPCFVNLGADGSFFMRTVSGGGSWELKGKSEGMQGTEKWLEKVDNFLGVAGLYLFPNYPDSYILLLTSGKAFSNLPEFTWADYNKMAPALPALAQSGLPIPCSPIIPQPQIVPVSPVQPQPRGGGCCPNTVHVHNCCPQQPVARPPPWGVMQVQQPQSYVNWGPNLQGATNGYRT